MSSYGEVTASQIASQQPAPTTMQNSAIGNGAGTSLPVTGYATAILDIVASVPIGGGTTINFEASVDNTTWVPILGSLAGTTTTGTTTTEVGNWSFSVAGFESLRARISAYSAGTVTVKGYTSVLTNAGSGGSGGASGNVNLNQVAGNSTAVNNGSANNGTIRVCIADDSAVAASQSGTWNINDVSGTVSLPTGAATEAKQPALGTAGSASSDVLSVQGIASMTALKVDGSAITQPISGSVTANAGTDLNTSALALESGGNLSTLASAVASSKIQSNTAQINGVAPSMNNGSADTGVQRITICDDSTGQIAQTASKVPASTTMQNAVSSSGDGASLNVEGFATGVISVTGTFTATVSFEASLDDSAWSPIIGTQTGTTTSATSTTTSGDWVFNVAGYKSLRARVTWTSGTSVTCNGYASVVAGSSGGSGGGNVNLNQVGGQSTATGNGDASSGVLRVTIANNSTGQFAQTASIVPNVTVMQNNAGTNGNGTSLNVQGFSTAVIDLSLSATNSGAYVMVNFEASPDDNNWFPLSGFIAGSGASNTIATASYYKNGSGIYVFDVSGFKSIRARMSNCLGGPTVTAKGYVSVVSGDQSVPNVAHMTVMQNETTAFSYGTPLNVEGSSNAIIEVLGDLFNSGYITATVDFQALIEDGATWVPIAGQNVTTKEFASSTTGTGSSNPGTGSFLFNTIGIKSLRAVVSSISGNRVNVKGTSLAGTNDLIQSIVKVSGIPRGKSGNLQVATGNGNGSTLNITGLNSIGVNVSTGGSSATATVNFEVSIDGTNWSSIYGLQAGTATFARSIDIVSATSNTTWMFRVGGYMYFRARVSNYSFGTVTSSAYFTDIVEFQPHIDQVSQTASPGPAAVTMQNAASNTGNGTSLDVQGYSTAALNIVGTASAIGTIIFEATFDDTTWVPIIGLRSLGGASTFCSFANGTSATGDWQFNVVGFKSMRARISAWSGAGGQSVTVKGYTSVMAGNVLKKTVVESSTIATYTANNPQYTVPATPTEMITFYGSASKVVKILRIELLTEQTTAGTNFIYIYRRTALPSGGSSTAVTAFQHDSSDAAATATMSYFTSNPSTLTGTTKLLDGWNIQSPAAASNIQPNWRVLFSVLDQEKPIVLRGTSEGMGINFNGAALPAGFKIQARITWTEE